jgi:hypothetical protein
LARSTPTIVERTQERGIIDLRVVPSVSRHPHQEYKVIDLSPRQRPREQMPSMTVVITASLDDENSPALVRDCREALPRQLHSSRAFHRERVERAPLIGDHCVRAPEQP